LAKTWRSEIFEDGHPFGLLDRVVESLIFELGRGLERTNELPGEAWGRASGLLPHSNSRGASTLSKEFRRLALVLDSASRQAGADENERAKVQHHLLAAHWLAQQEFLGRSLGQPRAGGLRVELFEQPKMTKRVIQAA
jgi:hypothetical protein